MAIEETNIKEENTANMSDNENEVSENENQTEPETAAQREASKSKKTQIDPSFCYADSRCSYQYYDAAAAL